MAKTSWVNQSLAFCLLSVAATSCVAGGASTSDDLAVDPGDLGGDAREPAIGPGSGGPGSGESAVPLPQPNRVPLPIILVRGGANLEEIGPLDYFFGVVERFESDGHQAFASDIDPLLSIEERAAQLALEVSAVLNATGASRVHLIAHGTGGLDARYLISTLDFGDRVATLTTISTPHQGTTLADVSLGLIPGPVNSILAFLTDVLSPGDLDPTTALYQMSQQYVTEVFAPANLDDSRVSYYSVAGVTAALTLDLTRVDLCDPLLLVGHLLLVNQGNNDGLVTVESARYGEFLGVIPADHYDEVGQTLGLISLAFNHLAFYSRLGRFLTSLSAPPPL